MRIIVCHLICLGLFLDFSERRQEAKSVLHHIHQHNLGRAFWSVLEKQREKTPNGEEELQLILAGLGKRSLTLNENITHSEVCNH